MEGVNKTLSMAEQDTARWKVVVEMPFAGKIALKQPDSRYWLIEDYAAPTDAAPRHLYFGRELKGAARARELVGVGDLKRRVYLGPTSLDNEVALLMASFAHVRKGSLVLDPFVGTGSILIACAQFGAHLCLGTDIDIRVLRGKKGRNIHSNFAQYGLTPPDLVRSDNALHGAHFRVLPLYDAIVCDPPYGIRAGARRTGSRRAEVKPVPEHLRADHIPQTRPYAVVRAGDAWAGLGLAWLVATIPQSHQQTLTPTPTPTPTGRRDAGLGGHGRRRAQAGGPARLPPARRPVARGAAPAGPPDP